MFLGSRFQNRNAVAAPSKVSDRLTDGASPGHGIDLRLVERLLPKLVTDVCVKWVGTAFVCILRVNLVCALS